MSKEITDLQQMMQTLATASTDPNAVSVGDFAKAVQSLQAELKMLEAEVSRLGSSVDNVFKGAPVPAAHETSPEPAMADTQIAAAKP